MPMWTPDEVAAQEEAERQRAAEVKAARELALNDFRACREILRRLRLHPNRRPFRTNHGDIKLLTTSVALLERNLRHLIANNTPDEAFKEAALAMDKESLNG